MSKRIEWNKKKEWLDNTWGGNLQDLELHLHVIAEVRSALSDWMKSQAVSENHSNHYHHVSGEICKVFNSDFLISTGART